MAEIPSYGAVNIVSAPICCSADTVFCYVYIIFNIVDHACCSSATFVCLYVLSLVTQSQNPQVKLAQTGITIKQAGRHSSDTLVSPCKVSIANNYLYPADTEQHYNLIEVVLLST